MKIFFFELKLKYFATNLPLSADRLHEFSRIEESALRVIIRVNSCHSWPIFLTHIRGSYFDISELLTKAIFLLSGDHEGVLIVPCPPYK